MSYSIKSPAIRWNFLFFKVQPSLSSNYSNNVAVNGFFPNHLHFSSCFSSMESRRVTFFGHGLFTCRHIRNWDILGLISFVVILNDVIFRQECLLTHIHCRRRRCCCSFCDDHQERFSSKKKKTKEWYVQYYLSIFSVKIVQLVVQSRVFSCISNVKYKKKFEKWDQSCKWSPVEIVKRRCPESVGWNSPIHSHFLSFALYGRDTIRIDRMRTFDNTYTNKSNLLSIHCFHRCIGTCDITEHHITRLRIDHSNVN